MARNSGREFSETGKIRNHRRNARTRIQDCKLVIGDVPGGSSAVFSPERFICTQRIEQIFNRKHLGRRIITALDAYVIESTEHVSLSVSVCSSTKTEVSPRSIPKPTRSRSSDILNMILSQPVMDYDSASDTDTSSGSQSPSETSSSSVWVKTNQLREPLPMKSEDYQSHSTRSKQKEGISICVNTPEFYSYASYKRQQR